MGGSQSVPIPGGGTEGYHVLRVYIFKKILCNNFNGFANGQFVIIHC